MTAKQLKGTHAPDGSLYITLTDGAGNLLNEVAAEVAVGVSTIASGTDKKVLYDNAGTLGEYSVSGTGTTVALTTSPTFVTPTLGAAAATSLTVTTVTVPGTTTPILTTAANVTSGAGALVGTLTNSPATGNPTKWIPFNDNGTTRYIPAW